jgi:dephospho-CoA kinase
MGGSLVRAVGLTGGIGSGKSTVAALLVDCGALLVDTDAIARALTVAQGAAIPALVAEFGPMILAPDGSLDRVRMRAQAFADVAAKTRLEGILHPLIGHEARRQASLAGERPVVYDIPLLTESSHWRSRVERVLVIDCGAEAQLQRVIQRPGWTAAAAQAVLNQQAPRAVRRAIADAIIHNDGISLADLQRQVQRLWLLWMGPSRAPRPRA